MKKIISKYAQANIVAGVLNPSFYYKVDGHTFLTPAGELLMEVMAQRKKEAEVLGMEVKLK